MKYFDFVCSNHSTWEILFLKQSVIYVGVTPKMGVLNKQFLVPSCYLVKVHVDVFLHTLPINRCFCFCFFLTA